MASRLVGLFKTLTWDDFRGRPDTSSTHLAFTSASFSLPPVTVTRGASRGSYVMNDNVVIRITMNSQRSWKKMSQIQARRNRTPAQLLKHEQGHYDIVALIARDLFIDLMQLKANTYSGQSAFNADVAPILNRYRGKEQQIIDKYDSRSESNHGDNGRGQDKWNRMIHSAFHTPRSPAQSAPDGKAYKLQLLQVLRNNGISI